MNYPRIVNSFEGAGKLGDDLSSSLDRNWSRLKHGAKCYALYERQDEKRGAIGKYAYVRYADNAGMVYAGK
ncbi:hypothetical protein F183_A21160 [Bryobacterales bacterium F-183]|nr:hypothetical protein F183_A21160 [Bryobacterales bacterium F-183]